MEAFRKAAESRDGDAMEALLADDVVFSSPVVFTPYPGKAITAAILRGVMRVFGDFRYTRTMASADSRDHALVFETSVDGKQVEGCDFVHLDDDGKIDALTVMVRPMSGAQALGAAMAAQFDQIKAEAVAASTPAG